jgi:hypothetical protein
MYEDNINLRIRMRVDFGDFKAFDFVEIDCGALPVVIVSLVPAFTHSKGKPTILECPCDSYSTLRSRILLYPQLNQRSIICEIQEIQDIQSILVRLTKRLPT